MKLVALMLLVFPMLAACGGDKPNPTTPSPTTGDATASATSPPTEMGGREGAVDGGGLGSIR